MEEILFINIIVYEMSFVFMIVDYNFLLKL